MGGCFRLYSLSLRRYTWGLTAENNSKEGGFDGDFSQNYSNIELNQLHGLYRCSNLNLIKPLTVKTDHHHGQCKIS